MNPEGQHLTGQHSYVTPIPDQLESADAAPMLCAGVTVYGTCSRSKCWPREGMLKYVNSRPTAFRCKVRSMGGHHRCRWRTRYVSCSSRILSHDYARRQKKLWQAITHKGCLTAARVSGWRYADFPCPKGHIACQAGILRSFFLPQKNLILVAGKPRHGASRHWYRRWL